MPGACVAGKGRPGRGWGSLRGTSQEINDLACLLRELVDRKGVGLRQLRGLLTPDHFTTGVVPPLSTLSERLSGKGLDWALVEAVIDVCAEDAIAKRRTAEAKRLWSRHRYAPTPAHDESRLEAVKPASGVDPVVDAQRHAIEAQSQLIRALEARATSEQALTNSTQLIGALLVMIGRLQAQVVELEQNGGAVDRVRTRLAAARNRLDRAEREMLTAETDQRDALLLVYETGERVAELQDALRALGHEDAIPQERAVDLWAVTGLVERASASADGALLGDVSAALRRIHAAIDECVRLVQGSSTGEAGLPAGDGPVLGEESGPGDAPRQAHAVARRAAAPSERGARAGAGHVWQKDEWANPLPELLRILDDLQRSGDSPRLGEVLRDVALLPVGEPAGALAALRDAGHGAMLRRVVKAVAERPGATVLETVLAMRRLSLHEDAERLMWNFERRGRAVGPVAAHVPAPGQRLAGSRFVTHYGPVPQFKPDHWDFRVFGATATRVNHSFTLKEVQGLPASRLSADLHCVSKWTVPENDWGGVLASDLLDIAPPAADVTHVMVWAEYGYSANLRLDDLADGRAILATHNHGERLSPEHGFPLRLVVPHLYGYKGPKWVRGMEYMTADRRGFWEERGYHNVGEVGREQRYSYQEEPGEGPVL
ncbi:Oxidoreductase molybdopterin binding domain-containing protein [Streptomyces sp. WMMB 714]|nr:Oxidoreductase molybdopterin binding domain-containing protein [Streptomyces sp. WMMB 714]